MVLALCWGCIIVFLFVCCIRSAVTAVTSVQVRTKFCTKKISCSALLTPHMFESLQWAGIFKSEEDIIGCMSVHCCVQDVVCYNALDYSCLREEVCLSRKSCCNFCCHLLQEKEY